MRALAALACLALACFILIADAPIPVGSQYVPCDIVNVTLSYSDPAPAGQPIQITSRVTVSCEMYAYYLIKVELADRSSKLVLSSSTYSYYATTSSVVATLTNDATAPQTAGNWPLQINVIVTRQQGGQVMASTSQIFSITVVPYTQTLTTTQEVSTTTNTETLSSATSVTSTGVSSVQTSRPTTSTQNTGIPSGLPTNAQLAVILVIGAMVFALYLMRKRAKRRGAADKTKVY
jgi:hypothetical protein